MGEWTDIADRIPEEREIVWYKTSDNVCHYGFYVLPYRAYPNGYFDPFKLASWCSGSLDTGNWRHTDEKPVAWMPTNQNILKGEYIPIYRWFPDKEW